MLNKHLHQNYSVTTDELLRNFDYLVKFNEKAKQPISVKNGDKIIALVLTASTIQQLDNAVEKLEDNYQLKKIENKELKKQLEKYKARCQLQDNINKDNENPFK